MSHIFISYSRKDIDLAGRIVQALAEDDLDTWIDWKSIPKGEDWEQEIYRGIQEADVFLFLISPDSVASQICNKEIDHAVRNGKRILPIAIRDADSKSIHPEISKRNWIFCRDSQDSFSQAIQEIRETIRTDYEWLMYHTRLQVAALDWERHQDSSRLLRGKELREAEQRLAESSNQEDPQPTRLQREYILNSQRNEVRIRRRIILALVAGLTAMAILAFVAWRQRNAAVQQAQISLSRQLAAQAISHLDEQYDLALLLAVQGSQINANNQVQANLAYVLRSKPQLVAYLRAKTGPGSNVQSDVTYVSRQTSPNLDVAFSPDGKFVIAGELDKGINLWSANTGQLLDEPSRSQLDEANNLLWTAQERKILSELKGEEIRRLGVLALSPDGTLLAEATTGREIVLWDVRAGVPSGRISDDKSYSHSALEFSPDGRMLASGGSNRTVRLWNVETRLPVGEPMSVHSGWVTDSVTDVAFSPDGSRLFSSSCAAEPARDVCPSGQIIVWDVKTQQLVTRLQGHTGGIDEIAVHPQGKKLASAGEDGAVILWDLTRQSFLMEQFEGHSLSVNDLAFSRDGNTLVSASSDGTFGLWDISGSQSNRMLTVLEKGNVNSIAFSPDGLLLASGDTKGKVRLWDGISYAPAGELAEKTGSSVESVEFSPDGKLLASGHYKGQIQLWNVRTRESVGELSSEAGDQLDLVSNLAFSPDGKLLISASIGEGFLARIGARGHVLVWDVQTQKKIGEVRDPQNGSAYSLAFSPDGTYFVLGFLDGRLQLVNAKTLEVFREWQAHLVTSSDLAFNQDGTLLASTGLDRTISLWDTRSWELVGSLAGHTGELRAVAFSPTGDHVASGGVDQVVRLWDVGLARWQKLACQRAGRNLTHTEWKRYIGSNIAYHATCPEYAIPTE